MNRNERRRAGIKGKEPVINIKAEDVQRMKEDATREAVDRAFVFMLAIPTMILHDKFGEIMKKEGREQRFVDLCLDLYDTFAKDYVGIEDLKRCLYEEAGVRFERRK